MGWVNALDESFEKQKQGLVKKLAGGRENLNLLQNMLKKELLNAEQRLRLTNEAKQGVNDVLYELTGDDFYRNV